MGHDTGTGGGRLRICAESAGAEDPAERQPRLLVGFEKENGRLFHGTRIQYAAYPAQQHYAFGQYGICGTRGWVSMQGEAADAKILAREVQRLQVSIQSAVDAGLEPIVFLHYPPIYGTSMNYEILEVLHKYQIRKCYYGHVHGKSGHNHAFQGMYEGTEMRMISSDYLQFVPEQIL